MMLKNIFKRLYHLLLYSFAFTILTVAILITVIRLTLPGIGSYRQQTQDWISQYMNYPVEISGIDANWDSWNPNLHLYQVNILNPVSNEHILTFNSVLISLDIFNSLLRNEITPESITVSDVDLTLIRRHDGSINVSKVLPNDTHAVKPNNDALTKWFLIQKNILVKKAQITLFDLNNTDAPFLLSDATLRMRNNNYRTQIEGTAILPEAYGNTLNFALEASGDVLTSDWSGEAYIEGKNINISPLLAEIEELDIDAHEGTGDIKLWSTWSQSKLRQLEGQVELKDLSLAGKQSGVSISRLSATFSAARRIDHGFELEVAMEELITINGVWPESVISLKKIYNDERDQYHFIAGASYLKLDDIDSFWKTFSNLPYDFLPTDISNLGGNLHNSVFKYNPNLEPAEQIYLQYEFSNLRGQFSDPELKFKGLSGHLQGTQGQGSLRLSSNTVELETQELPVQPLSLYELNAELDWQLHNEILVVNTSLMETHTEDFNLQLKGKLQFEQDRKLPFVDMLFEISAGEIDKLINYLPSKTPTKFTRWLSDSLVAGTMPSAEFVFRGLLDDYPFKNKEGVFQGLVEVSQATLRYHPRWPSIAEMDAKLIINGDTLTVNADSGKIYGAKIAQASAIIKNLARSEQKKSVVIAGHIDGKIKDSLRFIENSPLKTSQSLSDLPSQNIAGDMALDLNLNIPLAKGLILVDGTIVLNNALLNSEDIGIELTDLNGAIHFTQDSVTSKDVKAHYSNHPVELSIQSSHGSPVKRILSGRADNQFISAQLARHFPSLESLKTDIEKRITGSCLWEASIINTASKDNLNHARQLLITSSLEGLSIDLPSPLAKSFTSAPLEVSITFPEKNRQEINIEYSNILSGIIDVKEINDENFVTTSLSFGKKATLDNRENQLSITGNIEHLILSQWLDLIPETSSDASTKNKPVSLDIQIGFLEVINQEFTDLNLKIENFDSGYHMNINADSISGDAYLNNLNPENPVNINLQKLKLVKNKTDNNKNEIIPALIPPLNIEISELIYDDIELGQMNLVTSKTDNGLSVKSINFDKTDMSISGTGIWNMVNDIHHSKFKFSLNAATMKTMLETFNYDVAAIEEGETILLLDAEWQGTPADFSLNNLNGTLDMEINKGRFTDLDPSAGRLFGLLSLQTLPRRLTLDFSDLFNKGLAFDKIDGHFNIENGNAYTNNMSMTGPSVNIDISGRTGLKEQDYDQIATISPKMSDSLPVASALFGPVGVGVGAVIFLAGEIFQSIPDKIDTLLRKQYTITGAWHDPLVTKINQKEEQIQEKDNG